MTFSQPYLAILKQYKLFLTALRTPKLREQFISLLDGSASVPQGPWKELPWIAEGTVDDSAITESIQALKILLGPDSILTAHPVDEFPANLSERKELLKAVCQRLFTAMPQGRDWLTESEINSRLAMLVTDVAATRRYCVDFGFLQRSEDGRQYRLNAR